MTDKTTSHDSKSNTPICKNCYWFTEGYFCECGFTGYHIEPDSMVCDKFTIEKPPKPKKPRSKGTIWRDKEWKEKRSIIINEDSVCAWCGSKERLTIHHPPGTTIVSRIYQIKKEINQLFNEATKKERPDLKGNRKALNAYRRERFWSWLQESGNNDTWMHARTLAVEDYKSLEGTVIICNRCHYATHHGMEICQFCKTKYHSIKYMACPECEKKLEEERQRANEELKKEMNALGYY